MPVREELREYLQKAIDRKTKQYQFRGYGPADMARSMKSHMQDLVDRRMKQRRYPKYEE